jgi:two-component system OmpR family response regulator
MPKQILVIEDDSDIAKLLKLHLSDLFYDVVIANDGNKGLQLGHGADFDLIILDLMLPGLDGLEICRRLRNASVHTPILMLTAKSSELDRVLGLELGADDYLTKPFSFKELQARVKAIFRRIELSSKASEVSVEDNITVNDLVIEPSHRNVTVAGKSVMLTATEFDLLLHFARNPGRVYNRTQLLDTVWGYGHDGYEHTVNSHINRLRKKIEKDPAKADYILTVWGVGYKFNESKVHQAA